MSDFSDAIDRLLNLYNDGAYDVVDNPGGFDNNGHRENFLNALRDVATVGATAVAGVTGQPLVILTSGQSNFVNSMTLAWSPSSNAHVWNNSVGTVGTGSAFQAIDDANVSLPQRLVSEVARANPDRSIYLINCSFTGQAISHWLTGTGAPDAYADAKANVEAALAVLGVSKIDLFVWWQGEGDTGPLNTSYITNHATMMTRFHGETWFPREVPELIFSIASTAISGNTDGDHMNVLLAGVVAAKPDRRRFIYTASLTGATYWNAGDPGHMTALGYYTMGSTAASVFLNGPGRNVLEKVSVDPASGNVVLGNPGFSSATVAINRNAVGATLPATTASEQLVGADAADTFKIIDAFGGFTNYAGRRANGTLLAPTALVLDNLINGLGAQGHDGVGYVSGNKASISFFAAENWTATAHGTYSSVFNTLLGTNTSAESLRIAPGSIKINGTTSGGIAIAVPAVAGSNTLTLPAGTTNFSATGGTGQFVKQSSAGGAFTVSVIGASDLSGVIDTDGTLAANSDSKIASQKAVVTYFAARIAALDVMVFKGVSDCSANPNYPAADAGWTYRVSVAGKIGGASGTNVEAGDILLCLTDSTASGNQATVGANWSVIQTNVDGAVVGPASVTDDLPAIFDGASGKLIKSKTYAAFKVLLALVKGDVGLGNVDNTSNATERAAAAALTNKDLTSATNTFPALRGYLSGLTLSAAGSTATFGVAAGLASDSTNAATLSLAAAYTKTTSAWALGSGNGAMDTGTVANSTWYHVHLIKRVDTGVVDVLFSLSATAPTLPTNYTVFRRIGSMKTDGSAQWVKFIQDGDKFRWGTPVRDINGPANPGTSAVTRVLPSVPLGVRVQADLSAALLSTNGGGGAAFYLSDLSQDDVGAGTSAFTIAATNSNAAAASTVYTGAPASIMTDVSQSIRSRVGASTADLSPQIVVNGWTDMRGR
jgi:hypothetical protein